MKTRAQPPLRHALFLVAFSASIGAMAITPSASLAQTASPAAAPTTAAMLEDVRLPYGQIIRLREGEIRVSSGTVARDQTLVSIPYAYRRTAVLTADVVSGGFWGASKNALIKAGAKGYWAGNFSSFGGVFRTDGRDLWCFFGVDHKDKKAAWCFLSDNNGKYIIVSGGHLVTGFSLPQYAAGNLDVSFEEKQVEIIPDARIEYRFREWDEKDVDVHLFVADTFITNQAIDRQTDGTAILATQGGRLRLTEPGTDRRNVTAKLEAAPAPVAGAAGTGNGRVIGSAEDARVAVMEMLALAMRAAPSTTTLYTKVEGLTPDTNIRPVRAGEVVARESFVPARAGKLEASPLGRGNRFGAVGDYVFEAKLSGDRTVMCWRQHLAKSKDIPHLGMQTLSMCLEDKDKDGLYEILWKDPVFAAEMNYRVEAVATETKLEGSNPPVRIAPVPSTDMVRETVRLVYQGVNSERRDAGGEILPATARAEWRSGISERTTEPVMIHTFNLSPSFSGKSAFSETAPDVEIQDVAMDGTAKIKVLRGFAAESSDLGVAENQRFAKGLFDGIQAGRVSVAPPAPTAPATAAPPKP